MARILTEETSLSRKHKRMLQESRALQRWVPIEFGLAALVTVMGAVRWLVAGAPGIFILGVIGLVAGYAHRLRIQQNLQEAGNVQAGLQGEATVTRTLDRALDNTHYIFNDQIVRSGLQRAQLDHVVVSPNGIFVIETKNWRGQISGVADQPYWEQEKTRGSKPLRVPNPIRQVQRSSQILGGMLRNVGLSSASVIPLIVFRSPHTKVSIADAPVPILQPDSAARFIATHRLPAALSEDTVDAVLHMFLEMS